jgi:hypothetical protein
VQTRFRQISFLLNAATSDRRPFPRRLRAILASAL